MALFEGWPLVRVATYRGTTVVISRGNCPTHEGSCAIGIMSLGVDVPRGSCPRGSSFQG